MSYDEHLISMAGGDGEPGLDAIQARADKVAEWRKAFHAPQNSMDYSQRDVPALLALVRDQAAKLGRVEAALGGADRNVECGDVYGLWRNFSAIRAAITASEASK